MNNDDVSIWLRQIALEKSLQYFKSDSGMIYESCNDVLNVAEDFYKFLKGEVDGS